MAPLSECDHHENCTKNRKKMYRADGSGGAHGGAVASPDRYVNERTSHVMVTVRWSIIINEINICFASPPDMTNL